MILESLKIKNMRRVNFGDLLKRNNTKVKQNEMKET